MTSGRSLLLIADIGGYTEYMRSHRMSLAHAEVNTARLLEKVIDAAPDFDLIEIEGDAAFLARRADTLDGDATVALTLQAADGHAPGVPPRAAVRRDQPVPVQRLHPGEQPEAEVRRARRRGRHPDHQAAAQARRDRRDPRPPAAEEPRRGPRVRAPLRGALPHRGHADLPGPAHEVSQDLEGIGPVRAYFVDVADLPDPLPPLPDPSLLGRVGRTLAVAGSGMPYMLGLRRRRRTASAV